MGIVNSGTNSTGLKAGQAITNPDLSDPYKSTGPQRKTPLNGPGGPGYQRAPENPAKQYEAYEAYEKEFGEFYGR